MTIQLQYVIWWKTDGRSHVQAPSAWEGTERVKVADKAEFVRKFIAMWEDRGMWCRIYSARRVRDAAKKTA